VIRDARGVVFVVGEINLEIANSAALALQHAKARDRHPPDLELRASLERSSSIVRHARAFPDTTIFTSVALGAHCAPPRAHLAPVHLVRDPRMALHQRLHRRTYAAGVRHFSFPL